LTAHVTVWANCEVNHHHPILQDHPINMQDARRADIKAKRDKLEELRRLRKEREDAKKKPPVMHISQV
jgi:hypothetical protein